MFSDRFSDFLLQLLIMLAVSLLTSALAIGETSKEASQVSPVSNTDHGALVDKLALDWTELQLAKRDSPYLVLNVPRSTLDVRLKGRLLARFPIEFEMSRDKLVSKIAHLKKSDTGLPVEILTSKRLYGYTKCYSDSMIKMISSVVKTNPNNIHRYKPSSFELRFGTRLVIYVKTDVKPSDRDGWKTPFDLARGTILYLFTKTRIKIRANADDALTIYRMAEPGMPILIQTIE
ncbi:MAG: hypothetical protein ACUVUU_05820 [bacterium]